MNGGQKMDLIERATGDDLARGFLQDTKTGSRICLFCGREFADGEVFKVHDRLYTAERAVALHIEEAHGSAFEALMKLDRRRIGITDKQQELLFKMQAGLPDAQIARELGLAPSTIRHQRFMFKEKARQAKLYLAVYEQAAAPKTKEQALPDQQEFAQVHEGATMMDERYAVTHEEEEKIISQTFDSVEPPHLKFLSVKEKKKIVAFRLIASQFESGRIYNEKEVNAILKAIFDDYVTIRRYLIEYGFMERTRDCREYWIKGSRQTPSEHQKD